MQSNLLLSIVSLSCLVDDTHTCMGVNIFTFYPAYIFCVKYKIVGDIDCTASGMRIFKSSLARAIFR